MKIINKQIWLKLIPTAAGLLLIGLYYILIPHRAVMDVVKASSGYVRFILGQITSLVPFSIYELSVTLAILLIAVHLVWSVVYIARSGGTRFYALIRRLIPLANAAACIAAVFLWLWCSLYHATPFYYGVLDEKTPTEEELYRALEFFIDGANENAPRISRDEQGLINENVREVLKRAPDVLPFLSLTSEFPLLERYASPTPKPMMYSEIMSRTRFEGIYFALTGEANLNSGTPLAFLPSAAAHELAHAHGVAAEDEANFAAILASIMSPDPAFRYSGYLFAVTELGSALYKTNSGAYYELSSRYCEEIRIDLRQNSEYWSRYEETPAVVAVTAVYDGYLKSNGQELGIQSYGACVNLLSQWVAKNVS